MIDKIHCYNGRASVAIRVESHLVNLDDRGVLATETLKMFRTEEFGRSL